MHLGVLMSFFEENHESQTGKRSNLWRGNCAHSIHKIIASFSFLILLSSCINKSNIQITLPNKSNAIAPFNISVANVQVLNHQIIITGTNLNAVTAFKIKEGSNSADLQIESKNNTSIVANSISNMSFAAGKIFDFILSNASAASTFTVNFSLCDSMLGGKGFNCLIVPNDKDVLSFDAISGKWVPRNVNGLTYKGTFDASAALAPAGAPLAGDYYLISVAGTINSVSYLIGDWIVYNADDLEWQKVSNSKDVLSVFGRTGKISAKEGDYNLDKLSDVIIVGVPTTSSVLQFNGTHWVPASLVAPSAGAGTVGAPGFAFSGNTNTGFYNPAANQIGITNNGVESVRINAAGNVGIGTANPTSPLQVSSTNIATAGATFGVQITPTYNQPGGIASNTDFLVNRTETSVGSGAQYLIDTQVDGVSKFNITNTGNGYFSGNVGIKTLTPGSALDVKGTLRLSGATSGFVGFAPAAIAGDTTYTLPAADGTAGQVLTTNASGVLSWASVAGAVSGTSGGIPFYNSATTMTSSAPLGLNGLLVGGGAGGAPSSLGVGISGQYLKSAGAAAPGFSSIVMSDLKSSIVGNLFPASDCSVDQHLVYAVLTDSFTCVGGYWGAATGGINYAGGNVGIGTATPGAKLDVLSPSAQAINISSGNISAWTAYTIGRTSSDGYLGVAGAAAQLSDMAGVGNIILGSTNNDLLITAKSAVGVIRFGTGSADTEKMRIASNGNVGIGTTTPSSMLEVSGNIRQTTGQISSTPFNNSAAVSFDFNNGNIQYTSANCQAMTLTNMLNGGTYTIIVRGTVSGTCTFTHSSDTFYFMPANTSTVNGTRTIYSFMKVGTEIYVNWTSGYQ